MTNNRTTDLCKLLEERGVSYQTNYLHTVWHVGPKLYDARNNLDGTFTVDNLTPEQVIAATLGNSTLTAEQVRKVLLLHLPHREYYSVEQTDAWKEIADELNAELGSGMCRIESSYLNDFTSNHECWFEFEMQCGYKFTWDEMEPPTYCPNCGRKVQAK